MKIRDYRGFQIQVYSKGRRIVAEIIRKDKLLHTQDSDGSGEPLRSDVIALEAAKEWIDRTYPKGRIKYGGEV